MANKQRETIFLVGSKMRNGHDGPQKTIVEMFGCLSGVEIAFSTKTHGKGQDMLVIKASPARAKAIKGLLGATVVK